MTDPRNGRRIGSGRPPSALLGNLLRCGRCDGPMRSAGASCYCEDRRAGGPCEGMTVLVGRLDPYVVRRVASYLTALAPDDGDEDLDPRLVAVAERWTVYRAPEVDAETRDLAAAIDDAKASLAALGDDFYLHGRFPGAEGRQRYDRLSARLTERLAGLQELQIARRPPPLDVGPVLDLVNSIGEDDVPPALFADVVRLVVDRVVVTPAARRGERFSTDRVIIDPLDTDRKTPATVDV